MKAPARLRPPIDEGTEIKLLDTAIELFAERGFDQVTVRDIAEKAQTNHALIGYYFRSKEQLIKQVIRSVLSPLNKKRLEALAAFQQSGRPLRLADVIRAMVVPTVEACIGSSGRERHYARVLILAFALRQPFVDEVMSEALDEVAAEFVAALMRAAPKLSEAEAYWRYDFMVGALIHVLLDAARGGRLSRISDGLCDTSNPKAVTEQLVRFILGGFRS
jgi:AcrR family transcriptional regulator